jgi:hypothetical protein
MPPVLLRYPGSEAPRTCPHAPLILQRSPKRRRRSELQGARYRPLSGEVNDAKADARRRSPLRKSIFRRPRRRVIVRGGRDSVHPGPYSWQSLECSHYSTAATFDKHAIRNAFSGTNLVSGCQTLLTDPGRNRHPSRVRPRTACEGLQGLRSRRYRPRAFVQGVETRTEKTEQKCLLSGSTTKKADS